MTETGNIQGDRKSNRQKHRTTDRKQTQTKQMKLWDFKEIKTNKQMNQ